LKQPDLFNRKVFNHPGRNNYQQLQLPITVSIITKHQKLFDEQAIEF